MTIRVIFPLVTILCLGAAAAEEPIVALKGNLSDGLKQAHRVGALEKSEEVNLTIILSLRHRAEFESLVQRLHSPCDRSYHRYLKTGEFNDRFSPTQEDYDAVIAFAKNNGLRIRNTYASRMMLDVAASAGVVAKGLRVQLLRFKTADGQIVRGPEAEPSLPASIASRVAGISGLDDLVRRRSFCVGSDPNDGLIPADIKKAYNLHNLSLNGGGQILAIASISDFAEADIATYESCFSLPQVPLERIPINGGAAQPSAECTLDIEMALALAPGLSRILIYHTDSDSTGAMLARIAEDNRAQQVTISWGEREDNLTDQDRDFENIVFMRMAAQGQSVYVAAGDSGTAYPVKDPASQPYVVAVGGTSLAYARDTGYAFEAVWENSMGAGGGGISALWPLPNYQSTFVTPGSHGSDTFRNLPDVSLNADPQVGYAYCYGGRWLKGAGTSAAAPLWAAFNALVNQQRSLNGAGPLGFPNPTLYYLARTARYNDDFHDVIDSNIRGGFPAVQGYDNVTGLGSFNGANLLSDLQMNPITTVFHVDGNFAGSPQLGTPANPFKTVSGAANAASPTQPTLIYIRPNTYTENPLSLRKHLVLVTAGGGSVTIR